MSRYRVAVDVGGTFTDLIVHDEESGKVTIAKTASIPRDPAAAIMAALEQARIAPREMAFFAHGSTVGTNALITRRLPRTAIVATEGFRDVHEIRRGTKPDLWDAYSDVAPPYVRRRDRFEVPERVDQAGSVLAPLDEEAARRVARRIRDRGYEAVAVTFINAYMNGDHETRMKQILEEEAPGVFVCTSYEILPEVFEHERFSTTIINACLAPVVSRYLANLTNRLRDGEYTGDVLVLHSGGGVMTAEAISRNAARIAVSGPAAGAMAGAFFARQCGFDNAISLDMGGTSADISLMFGGEVRVANEWSVEFGYPIMFPSIEIVTIGAGGGSVAWIDAGGSLRNGPQSMGADPGPAAYQRGGEEATNTDANLVLGRLSPHGLLGGAMPLDRAAAERAVTEKIAKPLGYDAVHAADAIIQVANANMADAVRLISIRRGYDPRDFCLVAFGGAGSVHAAQLARELDIPAVVVPPYPGITSALGCLLLDVRHDLFRTYLTTAESASSAALEVEFEKLEAEARERLAVEGITGDQVQLRRLMDMRYVGQWRSLTVPVSTPLGENLDASLERFHAEHEREYAYSDRDQAVEIYGLRLVGLGLVDKPEFPKLERGGELAAARTGERPVYFGESGGFHDASVYDRAKLPAGARFDGPAIVEQMDSTVVVPPDWRAEVDDYGNIVLRLRA
ncbi:MAG: hydantoinase/oxoprolinase family protein [Thermomicrobiales bacterium]